MSALAGIFDRRGAPPTDAALRRVVAPVRHRGPDHLGTYRDPRGFAMTVALLAATPEDAGSTQPVVEAGTAIGFDGRIDNRTDLQRLLGPRTSSSQRPGIETDAELALRAFFRWGDDFAAQLVGDFALAVWQAQQRRLLLARDVTGQRQLLYYADARVVVFGTEIAQIIAHPDVPMHPNEAVVAEYIACDLQSLDDTLYRGVHRVPPAHCLVFDAATQRSVRYWDVNPRAALHHARDQDYIDHMRHVIDTAVLAHTRGDGPVAAQLSGGLDSSAVVAAATRQVTSNRVRSYSLVFPGRACDETSYIDAVVRHLGIASVREDPQTHAVIDPEHQAALYRDVPDFPNTVMHTALNRRMARDGMRVLLTGEGGDELWSGNFGHAADLLASGHLLASLRACRWDSRIASFSYPRFGFARHAVAPLLPAAMRDAATRGYRRLRPPVDALGPSLRPLTRASRLPVLAGASHAQAEVYADLYNGWAAQGNDTGGRYCARFGLESRAPLFDRRVIELAFSFPDRLKKRRDVPKYSLRRAFEGDLPRVVLGRRTKAVFDAVYTRDLTVFGPRLRTAAIARCGWVNKPVLDGIYSEWQGDPRRHALRLWMVLAIESWYKGVIR